MPILLLLAAAVIVVGVVSVAMGHGGEMAEFTTDYLPSDLVSAADVVLLRPPSALWGYNVQVTDDALNRIAQTITERDVEIAVLRQQLAELRSATGSHPAIAATLLARSKAASARGSATRKPGTPDAGTPDAGTPEASAQETSARETNAWEISAGQAGSPGGPVPAAGPADPPSPEQGTPGGDVPRNGAAGTIFPGSGFPGSGAPASGAPRSGAPRSGEAAAGRDD